MSYEKKISPESLLKKFSSKYSKVLKSDITTSQLSDALIRVTGKTGVLPDIKPLNGLKAFGKVVTVKTKSEDWGTVLNAIDIAQKGEIIFICSEKDDEALWGELTSKNAQMKGIAATIVYGAVRDVTAIKKLNYPVFSKKIVPNAGNPKGEGEVNVPLKCGNVTVKPADMIIGDENGVVVIPKEHLDDVIDEVLDIKKREAEIIRQLEAGISLSEIMGID